MPLTRIAKLASKFATDNSPTILTAMGVTGSLTSIFLASKASFKAAEVLAEEQKWIDTLDQGEQYILDAKGKTLLVWKLYIPAATTTAVTVICIIGANQIGTRRTAALAAAYSLSEKSFHEYKDKVSERLGGAKEQKIKDEVAQDRVAANPVGTREVIITGTGDVLCYDTYSSRYFKSSMEALKKAQNDLNYQILGHDYASLSDFYNLIGLSPTGFSDEVGWTTSRRMELAISTVLSDDQIPCIAISFEVEPVRDYYKFG